MAIKMIIDTSHWGLPFALDLVEDEFDSFICLTILCLSIYFGDE